MTVSYAIAGEVQGKQGEATHGLKTSTFFLCSTSRRGRTAGPPLALHGFAPGDHVLVQLEFVLMPTRGAMQFAPRA